MSAQFNARALELAVMEYNVLRELGDPVTPAAFGIAVAHLQGRLNLSLLHAAEMLRLELDRLVAIQTARKVESATSTLMDPEAQQARAEIVRGLKEKPKAE